ncbi:MAG: nitrate reductase cytochrome c-type subunit [Campylobacteraceae bacterium]|nr:nitrate reductase cytochrome c-type subunit [Campylobacteraceae bacterium]
MKRSTAIFSILIAVGAAALLMGAKADATVSDDKLGLAKVSVEADSALKTEAFSYQGKGPGENNKRIPRAYDNAPPMIPHDISAFGEITKDSNACIGCHMPEAAKAVGAIAVPPTHLTNLRTNTDLKGELYQGRYNCTQCHAPQAVLDPVVMNRFKGAFKKKTGGEYKSNLADTIREGVVIDNKGQQDLTQEGISY